MGARGGDAPVGMALASVDVRRGEGASVGTFGSRLYVAAVTDIRNHQTVTMMTARAFY